MGHKGCPRPPLRSPAAPKTRDSETPLPRPALLRPRPSPSPGRAEEAAPPALEDTRGKAASQPIAIGTLPCPLTEGERAANPVVARGILSPGRPREGPRLRMGWGDAGEGRRNSRSSWPRPCRRSAPPARPAGLSAPVARGPPSSRAGSGRARKPGQLEGSEGSCGAAGARVPEGPTHEASSRGGAKAAAQVATAGASARRLRLLCVQRADNPLRPRPRSVTQLTPPALAPRPGSSPALPLLGLPLPNSARCRLLGVPFLPRCTPALRVLHFTWVPAARFLDSPQPFPV